ncbi:MAG: transcription antitermination factor NusB [Acidimicrobiia bacterium]
MVNKTSSREHATLLFFESDSKDQAIGEVVESLDVAPSKYSLEIINEYLEKQEKVEDLISQNTKGWTTSRLPSFDRAVLRMAVSELIKNADVPVGTIISESVELCEKYSTPQSPKYINGVLSTIAHKVRGVELINNVNSSKSDENGSQND